MFGKVQSMWPFHYFCREQDTQVPFVQRVLTEPKVGRNDSCPCGSGMKFKKCCLNK